MRPFEGKFCLNKLYWAMVGSSSVVEIAMKGDDIIEIAQSGENSPACEEVLRKKYIRHQLDKISDGRIIGVLEESGADYSSEELSDRKENEIRLLWMAAWNAADDDEVSELGEVEKLRIRCDERIICCDWDHENPCNPDNLYDFEILIFGKTKKKLMIIRDGEIMEINGFSKFRIL